MPAAVGFVTHMPDMSDLELQVFMGIHMPEYGSIFYYSLSLKRVISGISGTNSIKTRVS